MVVVSSGGCKGSFFLTALQHPLSLKLFVRNLKGVPQWYSQGQKSSGGGVTSVKAIEEARKGGLMASFVKLLQLGKTGGLLGTHKKIHAVFSRSAQLPHKHLMSVQKAPSASGVRNVYRIFSVVATYTERRCILK